MESEPELPFTRLDAASLSPRKDAEKQTILKLIVKHLAFLGYNPERRKPAHDDEAPAYNVHPLNKGLPRLFITQPENGIVLVIINYTGRSKVSPETAAYFNNANRLMKVLKAHYEANENEKIQYSFECIYAGEYSKLSFSNFYNTIRVDIRDFHELEGNKEIIFGAGDD